MSATAPVYWVEGPWPGKVAIVPRPRGGDWLAREVSQLRREGIDLVVSLLERQESIDFDLSAEAAACKTEGIEFVGFPIPDRGVPSSRSATAKLLRQLEQHLRQGRNVVIHCRQGIGRSGIIAASLLAIGGVEIEEAFQRVKKSRGCHVPETDEQLEWTMRFARDLLSGVVE